MLIDAAVTRTLRERSELVSAVRAQTPKAWGALAAHGIVTLRELLGRAPTDTERRALWDALWHALWKDEDGLD